MNIRCNIPFSIYLSGESREALSPSASFVMTGFRLSVTFVGQDPIELPSSPPEERFFRRCSHIQLEAKEEAEGEAKLPDLIRAPGYPQLIKVLTTGANRVLTAVRNFGTVPHVSELRPIPEEAEEVLRHWKAEVSHDGQQWQPLLEERLGDLLGGLRVLFGQDEHIRELRVTTWPDIAEAIEDDVKPGPEQEFQTNALEHLRLRNFRLAIVEAVICLEIVLTQYLAQFLQFRKKLSNSRIKRFLSPDLGLKARLSGLLDLTLGEADLETINLPSVMTVVSWRNKITHDTGHPPEGLSEKTIREHIANVFRLVFLLARRRDEMAAEPDLAEIARKIAAECGVLPPQLWPLQGHRVLVHFTFILDRDLPDAERLEHICRRLSELLVTRDARFRQEEHLYIGFKTLTSGMRARWSGGRLVLLGTGG